jgi:3-(3-hydroxy-phenyl)propionate hydroxylase
MPPFGAQGLNSGARDAANITWKIAAALRGKVGLRALESYDSERRANVKETVDYSVRVGSLANIRSWPAALLRDAFFAIANLVPSVRRYFREMRYMPKPRLRGGLIVSHGQYGASPVGRMFPRPVLASDDAKGASFDALVGNDFALVGVNVSPEAVAEAARHPLWRKLQPTLISISSDNQFFASTEGVHICHSTNAVTKAALAVYDAQIAIVRPDRYVAGIARPDGLDAISSAFGGLIN